MIDKLRVARLVELKHFTDIGSAVNVSFTHCISLEMYVKLCNEPDNNES
jgi:hypothetical protein